MEALKSPEGEAISWGRPDLTRQVVDWVARGGPPRPADAVDCFEDLMRLVFAVARGGADLAPLRHALPNLHKVILLDESRHLVDEATDGLRDFDSFREVSTESCEAFHRHVAGFSTHGRDVFFAMAAVLLDFEEDLQALVPRVRRALLAVLRDDVLSDRCRLAATQGGYLEPMQMLESMEQLIQDQSIGSTS